MTLLVTGGAGFIGTNFVLYWRKLFPEAKIIVLDALTYAGNQDHVKHLVDDYFVFHKGCITDENLVGALLKQHAVEKIVHFAAESHVDRSIHEPDIFLKTNIMGTHTLLKAALKYNESANNPLHFHHVSTDEVYGTLDFEAKGFTEESKYAPNSPYSASKAASDHLVRAYFVTYGLPMTISNCSNNYGPYQHNEKLIPLVISKVLQGEPIPVYGNGQNVRDWLFVEDHCRALELILKNGTMGETYNIGGGTEFRNIDFVKQICLMLENTFEHNSKLADKFPNNPFVLGKRNESLITFVEDRKGHDLRYAIDSSKIENALNFRPQHNIEQGLRLTLDWYIQKYL